MCIKISHHAYLFTQQNSCVVAFYLNTPTNTRVCQRTLMQWTVLVYSPRWRKKHQAKCVWALYAWAFLNCAAHFSALPF